MLLYFADRTGDASLEPITDIKRMEQLMTTNLSGSALDLVMHGEGDPFAPGHVKPKSLQPKERKHNEMFLESEKRSMTNKNPSKYSPNEFDIKEFGEPTTETSSM